MLVIGLFSIASFEKGLGFFIHPHFFGVGILYIGMICEIPLGICSENGERHSVGL